MGVLTGKFTPHSRLPDDDVRGKDFAWLRHFADRRPNPATLATIKDILQTNGRTPAQGVLAWVWGRSGRTIPIPGFKTVAQVEENVGAMAAGPLDAGQMTEIERLVRPSCQ